MSKRTLYVRSVVFGRDKDKKCSGTVTQRKTRKSIGHLTFGQIEMPTLLVLLTRGPETACAKRINLNAYSCWHLNFD